MRPRRLLALLPALALSAALLAPAAAAATQTTTIHFDATESRAKSTPVPAHPGR
jgi:hypothetical protein